jgi:8-oxo-dGTP pyrophosphatase MutT (NUDIX family)
MILNGCVQPTEAFMAEVKVQRSAGGVVFQERDGKMWVALIATRDGTVWGLPKGLLEKGEKPLQTALREVCEEAGLEGEPVTDLGYIEYWYRDSAADVLYHKFVHYYLFSHLRGDVNEHDWEVDEARWFPIDEAIERASYENEKGVLVKAKDAWQSLSSSR